MSVFEKYAHYYDNLYQDKNYESECDFIEEVLNTHSLGSVESVLDLGCGTGTHAVILAERGFRVDALDRSEIMLESARKKDLSNKVRFHTDDIRSFKLDRQFDAIISMFAVMSYMTTNDDLLSVFTTVSRHLGPGGLFVFDCWFGPAVFSDPPSERIKDIVSGQERIIRLTRPAFDPVLQTVKVDFNVFRMKGNVLVDEVLESHIMRPLFVQELDVFAKLSDLRLIRACPFLRKDDSLSSNDWNACFVFQKLEQPGTWQLMT